MGLDMYLEAKLWLPTTDYKRDDDGMVAALPNSLSTTIASLLGVQGGDLDGASILRVEIPIGYWRKANAIHAWFIRNQESDDCNPIEMELSELEELDDLCAQVLAAGSDTEKCEDLLPPVAGFFFGGTDLDDPGVFAAYIEDVKHTRSIVARCRRVEASVELATKRRPVFQYQASW